MTRRAEIAGEELHAYIDGEMNDDAREAVQDAIAGDPSLQQKVAQYRADKAQIARVYALRDDDPLPRQWIARIESDTRASLWRDAMMPAIALAASLVLVLGLTIAFRQSAAPANGDIVAEALAARANEIGPKTIIAVHSTAEGALQDTAMASVLATPVHVPNLSRMGFRLVGIETYDSPERSFQLIYRDDNARVFTMYVRRSSGATRFDQFAENGLKICVWQDEDVGTVMAGRVSDAEMQRLEAIAYRGLTARGGA
jgi:anti-sigma factor RsiW